MSSDRAIDQHSAAVKKCEGSIRTGIRVSRAQSAVSGSTLRIGSHHFSQSVFLHVKWPARNLSNDVGHTPKCPQIGLASDDVKLFLNNNSVPGYGHTHVHTKTGKSFAELNLSFAIDWPIGYSVGLRIERSSVRIRPWPLR